MTEPVDLSEARAQVNIIDPGDTTFDDFLTGLIAPARAYVENATRLFWMATTRSETFSAWGESLPRHRPTCNGRGEYLEIYRKPIASVDSIEYIDESGVSQTYDPATAIIDLNQFPLRIYPGIDSSFPTLGRGGAVTVTYTSDALADTSEEYLLGKRAMLLLIGHWFANRESVLADNRAATVEVTQTVTDLIDALRPLSAY